ncbi:MAG: TIGR04279 domain-containing protein [Methanococci archaeon]|nr:TIGR04279 domain-containing protein [Methanococci archaeon]
MIVKRVIFYTLSLMLIFGTLSSNMGYDKKVVVLVSTPADAIVAAPYAKALGYKLVYTPTDYLSNNAKSKLEGASEVIIIGGPVAVSDNVENEIKSLGIKTERIWGETRIETSQKVFKALIKEKPEMAKNLVVVEGFNEKISPIAVDFNAPILYYGLGRDKEVINTIKSMKFNTSIILGKKIPIDIQSSVADVSKNTIIAYGDEEEVIKVAISALPKLNPEAKNEGIVLVYSQKSEDPILTAIENFVAGSVGAIVPLTYKSEDTIKAILSKIATITTSVYILSDDPEVDNIITTLAPSVGIHRVSTSTSEVSGGGGGGSYYVPPSPNPSIVVQKYTIISINNETDVVKFADIGDNKEDGNYVEVSGTSEIKLPEIKIITNAINKTYTIDGNNVSIIFEGNANALNLIYPIETGAITYGENVTVTFYGSKAFANKEVTLHIITSRQELRNAVNDLLNGNAGKLFDLLNSSPVKITKTADSNGDATFTVAPQNYGENIIIITEGNGTIKNNVTILGVGGFEYLKYKLSIVKDAYLGGTVYFNLSLNQTPETSVRYGLMLISGNGYKGTIYITGTTPHDKYFNVSIVGDKNSETIVQNSDLISLNASKVKNIIDTLFNSATAGAWYSDITNNRSKIAIITSDIPMGTNCYVIGIVYEPNTKKIVALNQTEILLK